MDGFISYKFSKPKVFNNPISSIAVVKSMKAPNVIFIVVDTLRKDYAAPLESELKKLGFISYENAIAPAPWTIPSHASMFTGLYLALHGAHETKSRKIPQINLKADDTIPTRLKELGYETYLLTSNPWVHPRYGFKGFGYVYEPQSSKILTRNSILSPSERTKLTELRISQKTKLALVKFLLLKKHFKLLLKGGLDYTARKLPIKKTYLLIKKWPKEKGAKSIVRTMERLKPSKKAPNLIFINLIEVHEPYFLLENHRKKIINNQKKNIPPDIKTIKNWRKKYAEEVSYVTRKILEIMKTLKENEAFANSIIIVTSDHGQMLGEHGRIGHGVFLYDELLRVPLLIKYPVGYEIERTDGKWKYITLAKLRTFILGVVENKLNNDATLYDSPVFAESYGMEHGIIPSNEKEKVNIENLEKYRIAVYHGDFKAIFNVNDWKFEDITSYNGAEITDEVVGLLKKEVLRFLKTASIAKVPKIEI